MHSTPESCWTCGAAGGDHADAAAFLTVHRYDRVLRPAGGAASFTTTAAVMHVRIPRCADCAAGTTLMDLATTATGFAALVLGAGVALDLVAGSVSAVAAAVVVVGLLWRRDLTARYGRRRDADYPPVRSLLDDGWFLGYPMTPGTM